MKKTITVLLVLVLAASLVVLAAPASADPATITVPDDYPTIQQAIDAATDYDTVYVRSGTYYENVIISRPLTLQGEAKDTTIIDGGGSGNVVTVNSTSDVTVSGFTIQNSGVATDSNASHGDSGLVLWYVEDSLVSDCIITSNGINGLFGYYSSHNTIEDCDFSDNCLSTIGYRGAIHLRYSSYNTIAGNNITSTDDSAICARSSSNNLTITGNNVYSNSGGIHIGHSSGCLVSGNVVDGNNDGVILDGGGGHTVENCAISNNGQGVYVLFGTSNNTFRGCNISFNDIGVALGSNSVSNNHFYHNNIVDNDIQVGYTPEYAELQVWDNGYPDGGNYWSDYVGVDEFSGPAQDIPGSDGIGDTPYLVGTNGWDDYPLMTPYGFVPPEIEVEIDRMKIKFDPTPNQDKIRIFEASFWLEEGANYDLAVDDVRVTIDGAVDIVIPAGSFERKPNKEKYVYRSAEGVEPVIVMKLNFETSEWFFKALGIDASAVDNCDGVTVTLAIGDMSGEDSLSMWVGSLEYPAGP